MISNTDDINECQIQSRAQSHHGRFMIEEAVKHCEGFPKKTVKVTDEHSWMCKGNKAVMQSVGIATFMGACGDCQCWEGSWSHSTVAQPTQGSDGRGKGPRLSVDHTGRHHDSVQ